ncbi:hypothetical protein D2E98_25570 [Mycobacteroides abscessus]|uniref:hypothetical protein n=1 Tax=Mycobacteroides abscessus TaxID=36809 RepID=UPI000D3EB24B|nr:hypothetical protein [Mycobacteroides abscessus]PVA87866.1 hypothetical protein DDJ47_16295 [Mycobacteroides abscessus]RIT33780.1 hypothetical protein D2E98_25570 [Mycobacteroides abscessus]
MVVQDAINHFGEFGALHEGFLGCPAICGWPIVAAVDFEAFEHGAVEELARGAGSGVVAVAGTAQQRQDNLQPVA